MKNERRKRNRVNIINTLIPKNNEETMNSENEDQWKECNKPRITKIIWK